jgi:hypothetical protein
MAYLAVEIPHITGGTNAMSLPPETCWLRDVLVCLSPLLFLTATPLCHASQGAGTEETTALRHSPLSLAPDWTDSGAQGEAWPAGIQQNSHPLFLQVVNPADKQREMQRAGAPTTEPSAAAERDPRRAANPFEGRRPSYELPAVEVVGEPAPELREEDRVGPYAQPRWTARRRFPGTRVYVRPPGTVEFEYWLRPTIDEGDTEIRTLYEISIGLPYRFQLDLYLRTDSDGNLEETFIGQQVEIRWALADWNRIWGNPTLYIEWVNLEQAPDKFEAKLLLGGEIAPRWHWGSNLVGEFETGGEREYEYQLTGGVSYTVIDSVFSIGAEAMLILTDTQDDRGDFDTGVLIGPSLQWHPFEQLRIDFAPLVGVTSDSPDFRAFLVVGWEF